MPSRRPAVPRNTTQRLDQRRLLDAIRAHRIGRQTAVMVPMSKQRPMSEYSPRRHQEMYRRAWSSRFQPVCPRRSANARAMLVSSVHSPAVKPCGPPARYPSTGAKLPLTSSPVSITIRTVRSTSRREYQCLASADGRFSLAWRRASLVRFMCCDGQRPARSVRTRDPPSPAGSLSCVGRVNRCTSTTTSP